MYWLLNYKWIVIILSILILVVIIVFGGLRLGISFILVGDDKFLVIIYILKFGEME